MIKDLTRIRNGFKSDSIHRFGDDLFAVIVDYLPLKDRIVFTSIDRQFNRCLFQKSIHFIIDNNNQNANQFNSIQELIHNNTDSDEESGEESDEELDENKRKPLKTINKIGFEWILKKCEFICGLDFSNCLVDSEVIHLICNHCKHLKEICFMDNNLNHIEHKDVIKFGQKCGKGLKKVIINPMISKSKKSIESLLSFCPNLKELQKSNAFCDCSQTSLSKLNSLSTTLSDLNCNEMKVFVNQFKEQIKSLNVNILLNDGISVSNLLQEISSFTHLQDLSLNFEKDPEINVKPIDKQLSQIAIKCQKLKKLTFCLNFCSYAMISDNLFSLLNQFLNLKVLKTCFPEIVFENETKDKNTTIKCFKSCEKLRELTLNYSKLNDKFLKGIHKYLPNLSSLTLETASEVTNKLLNSLSKLSHLKVFRLIKSNKRVNETFYGITDAGIESLLSSQTIESIVFYGRPQITRISIERLIETAHKNPKRMFIFICNYEHSHDCQPIDMKSFTDLPTNLEISISGPLDHNSDHSSDVTTDSVDSQESEEF